MTPRSRLAAGATTLILCGQYLVAEAIAASAWTRPYSYSRNYISDLGVTRCLEAGPCSPLGWVMNTGLILSGGLAVLAAALLTPVISSRQARRVVMGLALVHGVGSIVVGLVHSAPGTAAGTPHVHVYGAYAAIGGGNLSLIAAGLTTPRAWISAWFRFLSVSAGLFGIACGLALVVTRGWPPGLLERGSVDTITIWEVGCGLCLAIRLRHSREWAPLTSVSTLTDRPSSSGSHHSEDPRSHRTEALLPYARPPRP